MTLDPYYEEKVRKLVGTLNLFLVSPLKDLYDIFNCVVLQK